jgi:putative ABC transport system permease protein
MFSLIRALSLRQGRRRPARLGLMVLSVALGVAAWLTTRVLDRTLGAALNASASPLAGSVDFHVEQGDAGVPRALAVRLAKVPGVAAVRPLLVRRVLLMDPVRREAVLLGVDLAAEQARAGSAGVKVRGGAPADLARAMLSGGIPVAVGEGLEADLPRETRTFEILVAGMPRRLTRVATIEARAAGASLGGSVLLTDLDNAGRLVRDKDRVTRFDISLAPGANREQVRDALKAEAGRNAEVLSAEAHNARVQDALESLRIGFSLCGAGALVLALLLTAGAFAVGVAERGAEVGLLRALGADRGQVARLYVMEAAALGLLGASLGLPLGWVLARTSCGPLLRVVGDVFVPLDAQALEIDVWTCFSAAAAGVATTILAALVPTVRAALAEPLGLLAQRPTGGRRRGPWINLLGSVGAFATGWVCFNAGEGMVRIYATLVAMLAGAVLAIPAVTAFAGWLLRPIAEAWLGPPGRLAADRLIRHPIGAGVAIASLAGGIALIVQTGGVIHGNEEAVRSWVDTCIAGDLFITSGGPLSASGHTLPMCLDVGAKIESEVPGARAVAMSFRYLPWTHAGRQSRVMLLALDPRRYSEANRDRHPPLPDLALYRRLAEPDTALVSANFAALYGVAPGDTIALLGTSGPISLRVVGTVVDFSCSRGLVMVDRTRLGAALAISGADVFSVTVPPGTGIDRSVRSIAQAPWAAGHALVVVPREVLRAHILGMVGRLYGLAYVQELAAALVAALGVASALLISVLQRRRELGLLRAVGASPAQAVLVVLAEAGLMAVVGIAFGLLIGMMLEWYVLCVILLEETGFLFPVHFPWAHAALVAVLATAGTLLAGLGPALRAARLRIAEAIAYE